MIILAIVGALITGISLGLLGSGGTIFTVPILVYLLNYPEKLAVAESMAIVNLIAFAGAITYGIHKQIDWKSVLLFGIPGMFGAYYGSAVSIYVTGQIQMILFAIVMIFISWMMIWGSKRVSQMIPVKSSITWMILQGLAIGVMTGLIGCGGGFIIVPALVLLNNLSMLSAIGSSLTIIFFNTLIGFYKQLSLLQEYQFEINWSVIFLYSIIGIIGCILGQNYSKKVSQERLKQFFGVSVFFTALFMIVKNLN